MAAKNQHINTIESRSFLDKILLVVKGIAMGAANKVPGVSGGVVAFVAGFYEEFIYSLQKFNKTSLSLLFKGKFSAFFKYINGAFLGLLFLGMIISFFSVSKLLDFLIVNFETYVWCAFFGMILGSVYYMSKDFKKWNKITLTALLFGTILGLSISFLEPAKQNDNLFFVFFCGIISVSGMTLPGFSGSFILILLGNYVLLLVDSVNALYDTFSDCLKGNFNFYNNPTRLHLLKILAVFTGGSLVGLIGFSHILNYILKHYKNITIATIIGFIIGSLGVVWPWKNTIFKTNAAGNNILDAFNKPIILNYERYLPEFSLNTTLGIVYILIGFLIVLALEKYGKTNNSI